MVSDLGFAVAVAVAADAEVDAEVDLDKGTEGDFLDLDLGVEMAAASTDDGLS